MCLRLRKVNAKLCKCQLSGTMNLRFGFKNGTRRSANIMLRHKAGRRSPSRCERELTNCRSKFPVQEHLSSTSEPATHSQIQFFLMSTVLSLSLLLLLLFSLQHFSLLHDMLTLYTNFSLCICVHHHMRLSLSLPSYLGKNVRRFHIKQELLLLSSSC